MSNNEVLANVLAALKRTEAAKSKAKPRTEPYYNESTALWVRDHILRKIESGEKVKVQIEPGRKIETIACMLSQGRKYLFTHLDPDEHWHKVWSCTNVTRERSLSGQYYHFYPKMEINRVLQVVKEVDFYPALTDYLNSLSSAEEGSAVFVRHGLNLSTEDIATIKSMLEPFKEILTYHVDNIRLDIINTPTANDQ